MNGDESAPTAVRWHPSDDLVDGSRHVELMRLAGCRDLTELDRLGSERPAAFWDLVTEWLDFDWQRDYAAIADDLSLPEGTRWFIGGQFNLAENAVERWVRRGRGADLAVRWDDGEGDSGALNFEHLAAEVDRVAAGLRGLGVRVGDRVSMQLPMSVPALVASLAIAKLGAIAVPVFSGFGVDAVAVRLNFADVSVHITADGYRRRGREIDLASSTEELLALCPGVRHVVTVPMLGDSAKPRRGTDWASFPMVAPFEAERLDAEHPLLIAFTSGTTGVPKGVVLTHAGFAVKATSDVMLSLDAHHDDTLAWVTDPGWIMWPIFSLGGLLAGSAVALLPSTPDFPDERVLWRACAGAGVTLLGLSPSLIRALQRVEQDPESVDLASIRLFASSGEPWTPDAWEWLFSRVGREGLPIINYSGGTEVSGAILSNTVAMPIVACGFAGPLPGMGACIVDSDGVPIYGGVGELSLDHTSPGMPLTFWNDHERFHDTYWSRWPGRWYHGDWVAADSRGCWFILGRSDDTLKIAGKRIGPAEVEAVVNAIEGVHESAAIGIPHPVKGETLVLFVAVDQNRDVADEVAARIVTHFGPALLPQAVHCVDHLPRNRSGKVLRRLVRQAYLGLELGDTSSLESQAPLENIRAVAS
ncbi:AMP-binding protein [Ruicaihuangia caeni]|uniref:acetate--CoA ligase n=1 Tax=Ruicaihuangia caeni TaxID=3042517 RepID=A0AAW6T5F4_9MICO|nr:AMP-binding protein [Klugiella sp. YN-L-19]MDI2097388.1 AMP-binding protein [Klugiella sp. YN-L-19]